MQKFILFLSFFIAKAECFAQTLSLDSLKIKFDEYRMNNLQEKLFVHTDRDGYVSGEICWFKIYDVDAASNKEMPVSTIAYVEILDKNNKAVLQCKVSLNAGYGNGSLYLPITMSSGAYRFRAYTRWMQNTSPEFFFEKSILIVNTLSEELVNETIAEKKYDLQFFPEGGNLVDGIQSKVAFRLTDNTGIGIDFNGALTDETDHRVTGFSSFKFGIGNFSFIPQRNHRYRAIVNLPDGKTLSKDLPDIYDRGFVMSIEALDQGNIKVSAVSKDFKGPVYLFVHAGNNIEIAEMRQISENSAEFVVPLKALKEGISHFTLFDDAHRPVCERLYFNKAKSFLHLEVNTDKLSYKARERVSLSIKSLDTGLRSTASNMSVAVSRQSRLGQNSGPNIISYLLLTSDLAGNVEQPDYYFQEGKDDVDKALDNLMLTHGWRRFKWEELFSSKNKPEYLPEVNGQILSARLLNFSSQEATKKVVFFSSPQKRIVFSNSKSDSTGRVNFYSKPLYGINEIILQTQNNIDSLSKFELISPYSEKYSVRKFPSLDFDILKDTLLLNSSINMQILNTYHKNKLLQYKVISADSIPFFGHPDERYLLDNYTRFPTVEEVLREYVVGVGIRRRAGKPLMQVYTGSKESTFFEEDPLILFDGTPVFNQDRIFAYDPLKIKSIDVLTKQYFYGYSSFGGIINFATYSGDLDGFQIDPHATVLDYEGLQQEREFYSPVYDTAKKKESRLPDFRNLLFWSPEIITGLNRDAKIDFYTSDQPGTYTGIIQGLNSAGQPGFHIFNFEIVQSIN